MQNLRKPNMYLVLLKNNEQNKIVLDLDYFILSLNLQITNKQIFDIW